MVINGGGGGGGATYTPVGHTPEITVIFVCVNLNSDVGNEQNQSFDKI